MERSLLLILINSNLFGLMIKLFRTDNPVSLIEYYTKNLILCI